MGEEYIPSSHFEEITGKSIDKIIKSDIEDNPTKAITKKVEKAIGKKIGCSGKRYGFMGGSYSSNIDERLD